MLQIELREGRKVNAACQRALWSLTGSALHADQHVSASMEREVGMSACISTHPSAASCSCQRKGWTEDSYRNLNHASQVERKEVWRAY